MLLENRLEKAGNPHFIHGRNEHQANSRTRFDVPVEKTGSHCHQERKKPERCGPPWNGSFRSLFRRSGSQGVQAGGVRSVERVSAGSGSDGGEPLAGQPQERRSGQCRSGRSRHGVVQSGWMLSTGSQNFTNNFAPAAVLHRRDP